jgi:FkbM family methyltransferase
LGRLFERLGINCVLDVGANRGQYGRFLRQRGYQGQIISFEPVTADYALLQATAADDGKWQTYQLALGDKETTAEINVTSDSLFNSFLTPNDFIVGQGLRVNHTETVQVRPLDAIFEQLLAAVEQPRVYLKLDTQGYDQKVLVGGQKVLSRVAALQTELSVKPVYEQMPYYLDSIAQLEKAGFEVTGLFPIARDNALRVIEFDCVMVQTAVVGETTAVFPP